MHGRRKRRNFTYQDRGSWLEKSSGRRMSIISLSRKAGMHGGREIHDILLHEYKNYLHPLSCYHYQQAHEVANFQSLHQLSPTKN